MATLAEHTAARNDADLRARFVAAAEMAGISNLEQWVNQQIGRLVSAQVGDTTVTDVHAYADRGALPADRGRGRRHETGRSDHHR